MARYSFDLLAAKSRSDDTLFESIVPSLRDLERSIGCLSVGYAIASPTVNKVLFHAGHYSTKLMC